EDAVGEVGARLIRARDGVPPGHRAFAKARKLRENEPHPVGLLAAGPQLGQGADVGLALVLRVREPLEIERIGHLARILHVTIAAVSSLLRRPQITGQANPFFEGTDFSHAATYVAGADAGDPPFLGRLQGGRTAAPALHRLPRKLFPAAALL